MWQFVMSVTIGSILPHNDYTCKCYFLKCPPSPTITMLEFHKDYKLYTPESKHLWSVDPSPCLLLKGGHVGTWRCEFLVGCLLLMDGYRVNRRAGSGGARAGTKFPTKFPLETPLGTLLSLERPLSLLFLFFK